MSATPRTDAVILWPDGNESLLPRVYADFARQLETELAEVTKERDELKFWKQSAIAVENEWDCQKLGHLIDAPFGGSIRKALMQKVPELLAKVEQMRKALVESAKTFHYYESSHRLNGKPEKAEANRLAALKCEDALSSLPPPMVPMADVKPLVDLLGNFLRNYDFGEKADKAMESVLQTFLAKHPQP